MRMDMDMRSMVILLMQVCYLTMPHVAGVNCGHSHVG